MSLFYKLIILGLILALASPFIMKKPDGTPFMTWQQLMPDDVKSSFKKDTQLYRWKDDKGHWQYTDTPPENNQAERIVVKATINSMKTIELPEGYQPKKEEPVNPQNQNSGLSLPTTAPLTEVPKLLEDIDGIQAKYDARQSQIDAATR
ncbi:MAG: DUF4124 domain-containing protein [Bermanella sp.]